jgi:hypothetical protein
LKEKKKRESVSFSVMAYLSRRGRENTLKELEIFSESFLHGMKKDSLPRAKQNQKSSSCCASKNFFQ